MKSFLELDEHQLLISLRTKDAAHAFEMIYKKYWGNLYRSALKKTNSKQSSEELVQMVFEKIWRNRQNLEIKNLGAYLAIALKHTLYNAKRNEIAMKRINLQTYELHYNHTISENDVSKKLLIDTLNMILNELPNKTKAIFQLSRYENKSTRDIARDMGLSEKAIEYHITKTLKILRVKLREYLIAD